MKKPEDVRKQEDRLLNYSGEDAVVEAAVVKADSDVVPPMAQTTGVATFDRLMNGVESGELILVSGPTGEGKTTMLMSMTRNMALNGILSAWFTLEVTPQAFVRKIFKACGDKMPLFYMPRKNTDNQLEWLEERIIEAKVKYNIRVVFIDHVHQIFSLHKVSSGSISLELGDMVGKIKQMAIDHHLTIFLIAHTRDNGANPNAEPRKEEIRDSGLISRLADAILLVWRVKNEDKLESKKRPSDISEEDIKAKVRLVKNRREGKLGTWFMNHEDGLLNEVDF